MLAPHRWAIRARREYLAQHIERCVKAVHRSRGSPGQAFLMKSMACRLLSIARASSCRGAEIPILTVSRHPPCLHIHSLPPSTTLEESPSISNRRTLLKSKVATSLVASPKLSLFAPFEYSVVTTALNTHFVGELIVTPIRTWRLSRC